MRLPLFYSPEPLFFICEVELSQIVPHRVALPIRGQCLPGTMEFLVLAVLQPAATQGPHD